MLFLLIWWDVCCFGLRFGVGGLVVFLGRSVWFCDLSFRVFGDLLCVFAAWFAGFSCFSVVVVGC